MKLRAPTGSLYASYPSVRVHLDDLEQLTRILEDAGYTLKLSDDAYDYDSLAELREKKGVHPSRIDLEATEVSDLSVASQ